MVQNKVIIHGKEKFLKDLQKQEQERLKEIWNRAAAEKVNYIETKNA